MKRKSTLRLASIGAGLLLAGCGSVGNSMPANSSSSLNSQLITKAKQYYSHSTNSSLGPTYQVTSAQLYKNLQANPNGYFLMDVRAPNTTKAGPGYQQGHIKGAVNIPYSTVGQQLAKIPKNKPVIVICYTGQLANQTSAVLRILGYKSYALHLSMSDWNPKTDVLPSTAKVPSYPIITGSATG